MRLLGGGNVSALGALSGACAALLDVVGSRPKFVGGAPALHVLWCVCLLLFLAILSHAAVQEMRHSARHPWSAALWLAPAGTLV